VPETKVSKYGRLAGKDVILGIRPEDVHNPAFVPPGIHAAPVEGRVDVSELMGNEVFLYMMSGETTFVGRVDPRTQARMGDKMQVMFNMDNMHLFEPEGDQLAIQ
jgi:multiple sugar transport system ATP-binding protein